MYGINTPGLQMTDNDYAIGLVAEKLARSPYASDTLLFISRTSKHAEVPVPGREQNIWFPLREQASGTKGFHP
jgi:hypothetical protein